MQQSYEEMFLKINPLDAASAAKNKSKDIHLPSIDVSFASNRILCVLSQYIVICLLSYVLPALELPLPWHMEGGTVSSVGTVLESLHCCGTSLCVKCPSRRILPFSSSSRRCAQLFLGSRLLCSMIPFAWHRSSVTIHSPLSPCSRQTSGVTHSCARRQR